MSGVVVSGVRKLSTISEIDVDPAAESSGEIKWTESMTSFCSCGNPTEDSSTCTSFESSQPDAAEDCATVLLACLYCHFFEFIALLPDACERGFHRCFPSYKYYITSNEQNKSKDCCSWNLDCDCSVMDSCHETTELLELAMEISEVCYR
ncbi:myoD family inhibitor domain-containing protein 2 [Misgurnus anguillicaudatus]|uniref:myoD family inhibitor domain-containing protein 2 n=1 Tax=Misgurnus anguillicaudatus TaxID=75329 RepID=UPI002435A64F|nr:myoD family inhibitor domain-containing protein 2 [Misgurnus anguillicaudatus]